MWKEEEERRGGDNRLYKSRNLVTPNLCLRGYLSVSRMGPYFFRAIERVD